MSAHLCSADCRGMCHIPSCDMSGAHWHGGFYRLGNIRGSG